MNALLLRVLAVILLVALIAWSCSQVTQPSPGYTDALEITESATDWLPRADPAGTRYYHLKRANRLTREAQRTLAFTHGITFIEYLPRSGYIIKRRSSVTEGQLSALHDQPGLAMRHITPEARLDSSLRPAGGLSETVLVELGSPNGLTLPVWVSYRQDVPLGTQKLSAEAATHDLARNPVLRQRGPGGLTFWRVISTSARIQDLADQDIVRRVEPAGPSAQTDVGHAVGQVGGSLLAVNSEGVHIAQMEPCAPLTVHSGFQGGRVSRAAEPHPLCQPILADLSAFPTADKNEFDDDWPLWLDVDGDQIGDRCIWGGGGNPCPAGAAPTTAQWHWIKLDTTGGPQFHRYVHIENQTTVVAGQWRLCPSEPQEVDCVDLGAGGFRVLPQEVSAEEIGNELFAYSPIAHATHVAGIMVGDGEESVGFSPKSAGIAPKAELTGFSVGMAGDQSDAAYRDLLQSGPSSFDQIKVVNNSWGRMHGHENGDPNFWLAGRYDSYASGISQDGSPNEFDRRILIVGSAGNKGFNEVAGVERWRSTRLGNSSKNSLTVANLSKAESGSIPPALNPGSSRGPANDGRLTPLISAVGGRRDTTFEVVNDPESIRSAFPYEYGRMSGTSQAAPLVAATAAMVAEIYTDACAVPMHPAVVRGVMVHTADPISDALPEGPSFRTGYGRLNAGDAVEFAQTNRIQTHEITTGYVEYEVDVASSSMEDGDLRVTLTWDDPPWPELVAAGSSGSHLLNDLDLEVHDPDGTRYFPWILDPVNPALPAVQNSAGWFRPVDDGYRDHRNTIEQVVIRDADEGTWRIRVRSNHPLGASVAPQPFALVSSIFESGNCTVLTPRVVLHAIWLPGDTFLWWLFWVIVAIIIILLIVARLEAYGASPLTNAIPAEVPSQSKWKFWLFVLVLLLVFIALYAWMYGNLLWLLVLGILVLVWVLLW